ncbi:dethiobiotin synthase [Gilvimarinus sp. DA14]|uniref:dethiobiotin synthase n=1 Tax=Gilvimarinus sp. DA14 TaxID=2956798 RepID=UPI0020B6F9F1|nr:dethiobiotin synthase [Gilvimarinus sp. DA14]UTF59369.1 dethiobiotin synthase [Gilvimarinus sp. DA14]
MPAFFVTGTDTDVGKTRIAAALLYRARQRGMTTAAVKPVSAGCELTRDGLRNDDALRLQRECSPSLEYDAINPVAFQPPIAPHIAAQQLGHTVSMSELLNATEKTLAAAAEFALVEGAGGWRVPLNDDQTLADLAVSLGLPVVLVVGVRLGCINHAMLTCEAILRDGLPLAGWVANIVDPDVCSGAENISSLKARLPAPCLGVVPFCHATEPPDLADYLDLAPLLKRQ